MSNIFNTNDIIEVKPIQRLVDLSKNSKHKLIDKVMSREGQKKGLELTFNLSSSSRVINYRVYLPKSQRDGAYSWTSPYEKPMIRNHDPSGDVYGRISEVKWNPLDDQARAFFNSPIEYEQFKRIMEDGNPKKVYKAIKKYGFHVNDRWPGTGELVAKTRIFDKDAIEKFLDGRWLTFSAGADTDRLICGICGTDKARESCPHYPGEMYDDGDVGIFIPGIYVGKEVSIISEPANVFSIVRSISMTDSAKASGNIIEECFQTAFDKSILSDANLDISEDIMSEEDKEKDKVLLDEAAVASLVDKAVAAAVEAALTKINDAKKEQEPKVEDEKINWKIADRVFSSEVGVAIKDRKDTDPASCIGEENTIPLKSLEDVKVAKTLPEILGLSDALKAKFLSLIDAREKSIKEDQMTLLKDIQRDYEASLRIIDEQKTRITALEEEISNLKTKSVDNMKDEDENKTKMKDFGNVHNPSESSTPALDGKGTKLEDKLDTYTKNIVTRYKQILDSSGDKAASVYIRNLKSARYIPNNFNIDLYMEKE